MHGLVSGAAAALLFAAGGLTGAAWGNDSAERRLAQATAQGEAGPAGVAIEKLIEKVIELRKTGEVKGSLSAEQHRAAARAWENLAISHLRKNNSTSQRLAITYFNSASHYHDAQDIIRAEHLYSEALTAFQAGSGDRPADCRGEEAEDEPNGIWRPRDLEFEEKDHSRNACLKLRILTGQAILFRDTGRYADSLKKYTEALSLLDSNRTLSNQDTAYLYYSKGWLFYDMGDFVSAEDCFDRALMIERALSEHPSKNKASTLYSVGWLRQTLGLHETAYSYFLDSYKQRMSTLGKSHWDTTASMVALGENLLTRGLYLESEKFLRMALEYRLLNSGLAHRGTANSMVSLATLLRQAGRHDESLLLLDKAFRVQKLLTGIEHREVAYTLEEQGLNHFAIGQIGNAKALLERAHAVRTKVLGTEHPQSIRSAGALSLVYTHLGEPRKSSAINNKVMPLIMAQLTRQAQYLAKKDRTQLVRQFSAWIDLNIAPALLTNDFALTLYYRLNRQGMLEEIEKRQARLAFMPGAQQQIAQQLRSLTQQLASTFLTPDQREGIKVRHEKLERQLYRQLPELKPRIVAVEQVAAALPAASALIEFQRYQPYDGKKPADQRWGDARYLALVLKPDVSIAAVDLGPAAPIEQAIQEALRASQERLGDAEQLWAAVGQKVIDPLAAPVRGVNTLFISPDGELNRIPFAALPAPVSSQLLTDAVQLRMLTTGRELLDLQQPSAKAKTPPLVVANPAFGSSATEVAGGNDRISNSSSALAHKVESQQRSADLGSLRWNPLPGTAKEGQAIATLTKAKLLTQEQATASAVQQQPAPKLLHIASHAFFLADQEQAKTTGEFLSPVALAGNGGGLSDSALKSENPLLRSGIALAGANQPDADPTDDGYLTALEVAQLNWKGTELVVISACESGKGDIQAGEGVYGLKRAIAVAGARSSLLSLWKVDDRATAVFMESFYAKLKAGMGRADALAATQKEFREHKVASWRHPYVWAAFQLSGDWGAMSW